MATLERPKLDVRVIALKENARYLFRDIRLASTLTHYVTETQDPAYFMQELLKYFTQNGRKTRLIKPQERVIAVEETVWLQVLAADADRSGALDELRQMMQTEGTVLISYVVQLGPSLGWGRVQVSERWLRPKDEVPEVKGILSRMGRYQP